jgi:hypothetical protein
MGLEDVTADVAFCDHRVQVVPVDIYQVLQGVHGTHCIECSQRCKFGSIRRGASVEIDRAARRSDSHVASSLEVPRWDGGPENRRPGQEH